MRPAACLFVRDPPIARSGEGTAAAIPLNHPLPRLPSTSRTKRRFPAVSPASTASVAPVTPDAASLARNSAARATSVGLTNRPSG